jgi:hypothetical protein
MRSRGLFVVLGIAILCVACGATAGAPDVGSRPAAGVADETTAGSGVMSGGRPLIFGKGDAIYRKVGSRRPITTVRQATGRLGFGSLAVARGSIYWSVPSSGRKAPAKVESYSLRSKHRRLVLSDAGRGTADFTISHGYLYWGGATAIGRVKLNGTEERRNFLPLPKTGDGGVEDGLASDGRALYFSQCEKDRIGTVALTSGARRAIRWIVHTQCPQSLAVAGGFLYWAKVGLPPTDGTIGRSSSDGREVSESWLSIRTPDGPTCLGIDGTYVYWCSGTEAGGSHIGRASLAKGRAFSPRYLRGAGPVAP